jgi:hypothetical protein
MFEVFIDDKERKVSRGLTMDGEFEKQSYVHTVTYREREGFVVLSHTHRHTHRSVYCSLSLHFISSVCVC